MRQRNSQAWYSFSYLHYYYYLFIYKPYDVSFMCTLLFVVPLFQLDEQISAYVQQVTNLWPLSHTHAHKKNIGFFKKEEEYCCAYLFCCVINPSLNIGHNTPLWQNGGPCSRREAAPAKG